MFMIRRVPFVPSAWLTLAAITAGVEPRPASRNVVLVTADGLCR